MGHSASRMILAVAGRPASGRVPGLGRSGCVPATRQRGDVVVKPDVETMGIAPEERTMAMFAHLSGLSGYIIPLGGAVVPLVIWLVRRDSLAISTIAKQALWLNLVVFLVFAASWVLMLTVVLIPLVLVTWGVLGLAALVLPVIGAIRANEGIYYRYPVVGLRPDSPA